jgi:hypothetical protein
VLPSIPIPKRPTVGRTLRRDNITQRALQILNSAAQSVRFGFRCVSGKARASSIRVCGCYVTERGDKRIRVETTTVRLYRLSWDVWSCTRMRGRKIGGRAVPLV